MMFTKRWRMRFNLIALMFVVFLFTGCDYSIKWLNGEWEGVGCQLDMEDNDTWFINLEIDIDKQLFDIEYPSLGCAGNWELIDYSSDRAIFNELITENDKNDCIEKGTVILTKVDEKHISFSYYIYSDKDVLAFSTLRRK